MKKNALVPVLIMTVMAFSAPRGAAAFDFQSLSGPLQLTEAAAVPVPPAPVKAAPKPCKPFLLSVAVGGVDETVAIERACTPENEPVWALFVTRRGAKRNSIVRVSSDEYPAERTKLEKRIKAMVTEGINQEDADFIVMKTGPALKKADAAPLEEKETILAEATEGLKDQLAK